MTLEEIRAKKADAEFLVAQMLKTLEAETGATISSVTVSYLDYIGGRREVAAVQISMVL